MSSIRSRSVLYPLLAAPTLALSLLTPSTDPAAVDPIDFDAAPMVAPPNLARAQETTTVLTNALVAAVASISDATPPGSTALEIEAGSDAVSALVPNHSRIYRLIDASGQPLDSRNKARGPFETQGLAQLVAGAPQIQQQIGNKLRTLVPLTNDMHANCATCHGNYAAMPPGTVVGAASLRVRL